MPESKKERRFMGMVHAVQSGQIDAPSANIAKAAKKIKPSVAKEIGSSSEKGLPESKTPKHLRHGKDHVTVIDSKIRKI